MTYLYHHSAAIHCGSDCDEANASARGIEKAYMTDVYRDEEPENENKISTVSAGVLASGRAI